MENGQEAGVLESSSGLILEQQQSPQGFSFPLLLSFSAASVKFFCSVSGSGRKIFSTCTAEANCCSEKG